MPKPKPTNIVCDTCGLDWKKHKENAKGTVPLTECVRLLKVELASRATSPIFFPYGSSASMSTGGNIVARGIPLN